ncbi:MAG: bis(5'-nucleosyl)-tetraphosphatase (symmetrical) YqeK, partial [Treponema sp.]|nr:bis(5'-nucleosyl)-tetraphosphatase (symmetrical) YqeK [Treponema sp.]
HLHLADSVLTAFCFDHLLLVPANISPFKQTPGGTALAGDRLDMILASITADPRIIADDLELRRGGISYTIDTLREIISRYRPEAKPALILGDDLTTDFSKWKDAEEISRIADIIIARRMTSTGEQEFPYHHRVLTNEIMDISSAMIRERIALNGAWHYLVPQGARHIIEERGLYLFQTNTVGFYTGQNAGLLARVEDTARAVLPAERFIHSRNTAILARDLALRYGLDGSAAYLAGIAHDLAKNEPPVSPAEQTDVSPDWKSTGSSPALNHGKAAAVLLQERFGIHNKDVLEAIELHTTGKPRMGDLARVVFIADKIEFSRKNVQNMLQNNEKEPGGLKELFYAVLKNHVKWLEKKGIKTAEETLELLKEEPGY